MTQALTQHNSHTTSRVFLDTKPREINTVQDAIEAAVIVGEIWYHKNEIQKLKTQGKLHLDEAKRIHEEFYVSLFYKTLGLKPLESNQCEAISKVFAEYLANGVITEVKGETIEFELNSTKPYVAFYQKHADAKAFDVQNFKKVSDLPRLIEYATLSTSTIEKIVMNPTVQAALTTDEQAALINAVKMRKGSLKLQLATQNPIATPKENTHPIPPQANFKIGQLPNQQGQVSTQPKIGQERVQTTEHKNEHGPQQKWNLEPFREKMRGKKIDGKPAFEIFEQFFANNPNASLTDGINYLKSLQIKS